MLLEIRFEAQRADGTKVPNVKGSKVVTFKCDFCERVFEVRGYENAKSKLRRSRHYCDRTCSARGRASDPEQRRQLIEAITKGREIAFHRHGNPMNAPQARKKVSRSLKQTLQAQREKNDGLTNTQITLLERYGVTCAYQLPAVAAKAHSDEAHVKRVATMANNVSRTSKIEDEYYEALKQRYGDDQVLRQVIDPEHLKWAIDFYVVSLHTFVQIDGVYWHGLDRPLDVIRQFTHPRDRIIYQKWLTDREQDEVFRRRGVRLVRVTDLQFKKGIVLP